MTFCVAMHMPKGYRPMTDVEIARLAWGSLVDVLDTHNGAVAKGSVISENRGGALVKFRSGFTTLLGKGQTDEQFVAVTTQLADEIDDPNNALAVALRASNEIAKLKGRCRVLEDEKARTNDRLQAMLADLEGLRDQLRALQLKQVA